MSPSDKLKSCVKLYSTITFSESMMDAKLQKRRRSSSSDSDNVKSNIKRREDDEKVRDKDKEEKRNRRKKGRDRSGSRNRKSSRDKRSRSTESEKEDSDKERHKVKKRVKKYVKESLEEREKDKEKDKDEKYKEKKRDKMYKEKDERYKESEKENSEKERNKERKREKRYLKESSEEREKCKEKDKDEKYRGNETEEKYKKSDREHNEKDEDEKYKEKKRDEKYKEKDERYKEREKENSEKERNKERKREKRYLKESSEEREKCKEKDKDEKCRGNETEEKYKKSDREHNEKDEDEKYQESEREDRNRERDREEKYRNRNKDDRYRDREDRYRDRDREDGYRERDRSDRYRDKEREDRYRDRDRKDRYRERDREDRYRERDREDWYRERDREDRYKQRNEDSDHGEISNSYYGTELKKSSNDSKENMKGDIPDETIPPKQRKIVDALTSKTGGAYIPPAKLRMMQAQINDKSGPAYQRIAWEALKKSIHGFINKVNTSNIGPITRDILKENIVRGRGLLARSVIQAQAASLTFTPVYAALVSVINSKFPNIGELILTRLAVQFKRGFRRNDKTICISSATFIAHLVNQGVAHEILILEILTILVQNPTEDSIEVAIAVLKECGMKLTEVCNKGIVAIFENLRNILHEGQLDIRIQYMIEVIFQIRKDGFKDFESVPKELDLVEEEDQIVHIIGLDDALDGQDILNVFKFDAEYTANEEKYKELSKEILNTDDSGSDDEGGSEDEEEEEESDENKEEEKADGGVIIDKTETNLTALRRTIYLTIHSSLNFEECAHKLMKMQLKPGQELELCHMILDCCAEMRTYEKFYGLLAGRFCKLNRTYISSFEQIFKDSYDTIHRLDTNRLRNVAKFFAHLLITDSISWAVLSNIKLNEEDTTSSGRVFIKILFQELSEYMGLPKLNGKLKDEELQEAFSGLFPKDDPKNTRFAINFFTAIGLGGLTDDLREHLKNRPKPVPEPVVEVKEEKAPSNNSISSSSSSTSSSSSSSSSSDSSSDSSSETESSEDEKKKRNKRRKKKKVTKKENKKEKNQKREKSVEKKDKKRRKK